MRTAFSYIRDNYHILQFEFLGETIYMDEFENVKKNDISKRLSNWIDVTSGSISGILGFDVQDMLSALFAGAAGIGVQILLRACLEISKRQCSEREKVRVLTASAIAASEIRQIRESGGSLRDDGFFDENPRGRSDAEEIAEAIMLKCQREPQEKKIEYMGYLLANIAFDSNISADMGHQLIKAAEELTYRQLCILKLAVVKDRFGLRNQDYQNNVRFSKELYQVLQECHDLCLKSYLDYKIPLTFRGQITFGYTNIQPNKMTIYGIGEDLFHLMKLSAIPDEDIIPIAEVLE